MSQSPSDQVQARFQEGEHHLAQNRLDQARSSFEAALALDPGHADSLNKLGVLAVRQGDRASAREYFQRALASESKHVRAATNLGNLAFEEQRYQEAIEQYQKAIAVDSGYFIAYQNLAAAYRKTGQIAQAVQHLKRAQRLELSRAAGGMWSIFTGGPVRDRRPESDPLQPRRRTLGNTVFWVAIGALLWLLLRRFFTQQ